MSEKTFYSMEEIDKTFFPKEYRREKKKKLIEKIGFGTWLARQFFAFMRRELKKAK